MDDFAFACVDFALASFAKAAFLVLDLFRALRRGGEAIMLKAKREIPWSNMRRSTTTKSNERLIIKQTKILYLEHVDSTEEHTETLLLLSEL